jgi:hypothetical protein
MAAQLARQLLAGRPAIWIREPGAVHRDSAAEVVLRLMARPMSAAAWLASLGIETGHLQREPMAESTVPIEPEAGIVAGSQRR